MATQKLAISIDDNLVVAIDALVANKVFASRSEAIRIAVREKIARIERSRLARECSKLDPAFEQAMAEEGLSEESSQWPDY